MIDLSLEEDNFFLFLSSFIIPFSKAHLQPELLLFFSLILLLSHHHHENKVTPLIQNSLHPMILNLHLCAYKFLSDDSNKCFMLKLTMMMIKELKMKMKLNPF